MTSVVFERYCFVTRGQQESIQVTPSNNINTHVSLWKHVYWWCQIDIQEHTRLESRTDNITSCFYKNTPVSDINKGTTNHLSQQRHRRVIRKRFNTVSFGLAYTQHNTRPWVGGSRQEERGQGGHFFMGLVCQWGRVVQEGE